MIVSVREEMLSMISDMIKDVYGFRVSMSIYEDHTEEQLKEEMNRLQIQVEAEIEREEQEQKDAIVRFEAYIAEMMKDHGIDRTTAIRWDIEAEETGEDYGYYCWKKNLPYTYETKLMTG